MVGSRHGFGCRFGGATVGCESSLDADIGASYFLSRIPGHFGMHAILSLAHPWTVILALLVSGGSDGLLIIWSADHIHDSRELLPKLSMKIRKMDLEARSLQPSVKAVLLTSCGSKSDLNNLKAEVKRISSSNLNNATREELLDAGRADTLAIGEGAEC